MTTEEFDKLFRKALDLANSYMEELRYGQSVYNAVHEVFKDYDPDVLHDLKYDCFYLDYKTYSFIQELKRELIN